GEPRQILGVDVVGEDVIDGRQHRIPALQAVERQTVGGIDAGRAQDGNAHATAAAEIAQATLGIDATLRARGTGATGTRFIDQRAAAIAVNPCRAYVYEALW